MPLGAPRRCQARLHCDGFGIRISSAAESNGPRLHLPLQRRAGQIGEEFANCVVLRSSNSEIRFL